MSETLGEPELSFPDRDGLGWVGLLGGLACLLPGLLLLGLMPTATSTSWTADALGGVCLVVALLLLGFGFSYSSLRDIVGKPTWHVSRTHVWRVRGGRVVDRLALRDQRSVRIVDVRRRGVTVRNKVQLDDQSITVPDQDAARRVWEHWRRATAQ